MSARGEKFLVEASRHSVAGFSLASVHRDVLRSALAGPLRFVVPIAGYFILYPLLLDRAGITVLGLWSLLSTLTSYISMADVGFSQLITREAGRDRDAGAMRAIEQDYLAARRLYAVICVVILAGLAIAGTRPFEGLAEYYPPGALWLATMVLVLGASLQITARLDAAVLAARNDNYGVQLVLAITPVFPFAASAVGVLTGVPIEGLAVGSLLAGVAQIVIFRWRLARRHPQWRSGAPALSLGDMVAHLRSLMRRGGHFYAISLGFILREPVFRLVLAVALGPAAVGVYDIAMRVTRTVRDVIASGFTALFPGLAFLHRAEAREESIRLLRVSLLTLVAAGAGGFLLLVLFGGDFFTLWLGDMPQGLIAATRILVIGNLITLTNVPFWYLLQASDNENLGAYALWLQTAAVLVLIPLNYFVTLDLYTMMIYWVGTEGLMLVMICWFSQTRLRLFLAVASSPRMGILAAVAVAFLAAAWMMPASGLGAKLVLVGAYAGAVLPIVWYPLRQFIALARSDTT